MNTTIALEAFVSELLAVVASLPLVVAGIRNRPFLPRWRLFGLGVLVLLATTLATCSNAIFGMQPSGLKWNWIGKLASMLALAMLIPILPRGTMKRSGMFRLPSKDSALPVFVSLSFCAFLGWAASLAPGLEADSETLAFQSLMPSLAEEPVFSGILPALLAPAFGSPWKLGRARVGWWWLVISFWFAAGHGLFWSTSGGVEFHPVEFITTGMVTLLFIWLAVRSRSVWPCVIGHTLINATGRIWIAMFAS